MELFERGLVTGSSISLFQMSQKDLRSRDQQKGTDSFAQMTPETCILVWAIYLSTWKVLLAVVKYCVLLGITTVGVLKLNLQNGKENKIG